MPRIQELTPLPSMTGSSKVAGANPGTGSFTGQQVVDFLLANGGATGQALFAAASAAAARGTLGASTIGNAIFTAADAATARVTLGGTTAGVNVFTAPDTATARAALLTPALPVTATGVGQWKFTPFNDGAAAVLPAGGTWAYFLLRVITSSGGVEVQNCVAGVAAGGTQVAAGTSGFLYAGLTWRIA